MPSKSVIFHNFKTFEESVIVTINASSARALDVALPAIRDALLEMDGRVWDEARV